mmetsp:Transcript_13668/g.41613  ORF Transcript_13668/g.41613 Transcript_13668/m.41613 type:complete len:93 (+) Transcript_13668:706-984(+)
MGHTAFSALHGWSEPAPEYLSRPLGSGEACGCDFSDDAEALGLAVASPYVLRVQLFLFVNLVPMDLTWLPNSLHAIREHRPALDRHLVPHRL